jgi:hypothetical protein
MLCSSCASAAAMIWVSESCAAAAAAAAGPAAAVIMSRAVLLVNWSVCGTDMRGPVASRSSSVIGAAAMTPLQPEAGAHSLTAAKREGAVSVARAGMVVRDRGWTRGMRVCGSGGVQSICLLGEAFSQYKYNEPSDHVAACADRVASMCNNSSCGQRNTPVSLGSTYPPASATQVLRADRGSSVSLSRSVSADFTLWPRQCLLCLPCLEAAATAPAATCPLAA